jgi:UDP-N-acetylglucosamine--N-acetylmuramyl-(pentapeptide) pyrophosphoryl-undecaprenol N-acetylglucosamine transferase
MKILIMAGGTGGHVFPALAVAQALRDRGHEIVWMGAPDSFEARVVPQHAIPLEFVRVSGLRGKGVLKLLWAPLILCRALLQAMAALRRQRPQVVLGMGGFASGPGGVAAWLLRRPLLIHEQNAVAGLTNRALSWLACHTLQAFPGTFRSAGALTVGNPVRTALTGLPHPAERLAHRSGPLRVLVIGGSQGARALNERLPEALACLPAAQRPEVWHQAGRTLDLAQSAYARAQVPVRLEAFIADMAAAYGWADLVVCRAGASTVAELCAAGCAALLVPFPHAVDDHQTANGQYLVQGGAALLVQERDLSAELLAQRLRDLLADRARLTRMAQAARRLAWHDAAERIADHCLDAGGR